MSHIVTLPYDPVWRALDWAKKYCPSYITNHVHKDSNSKRNPEYIDYFFSEAKDANWFALRWL